MEATEEESEDFETQDAFQRTLVIKANPQENRQGRYETDVYLRVLL